MKYTLVIFIICLAGFIFWTYRAGFLRAYEYKKADVYIGEHHFVVDVADSDAKRALGLSGRKELADDGGMLFTFLGKKTRSFWMKDMLIPIDIVWIEDSRIAGIEHSVAPEPDVSLFSLKRYSSPVPVNFVLETPAGKMKEIGASVGDEVRIDIKDKL